MTKLNITSKQILAHHPAIHLQIDPLFNGDERDNVELPWKGGIAVPKESNIPEHDISGQMFIVDLLGLVDLDVIRVHDTNGTRELNVFIGNTPLDPIFIERITLDGYLSWHEIPVKKEARYIFFSNPENAIGGINEIEVYGEYLEKDTTQHFEPFTGRKIIDSWGVTTHDYDHVPSVPEKDLYNIADINPTKVWRTYWEINKNEDVGTKLKFENIKPGGIKRQDIEDAKANGVRLMISPVQNLTHFTESYPNEVRDRNDLPFFKWNTELTYKENRELMYLPESYSDFRDVMLQLAEFVKDDTESVIIQYINELDKTWKSEYHFMNAFQVAAMHSMLWDGHEGKYGKGIKDVNPNFKIAWLSQAYNNIGYTKLANEWFKKYRSDGEFCADIICTNSYCNNQGGLQHVEGSHGIPAEGSHWLDQIKRFYQFSRSLGKEFAITEFGYDSAGISKQTVMINSEQAADREYYKNLLTWQEQEDYYDNTYWPKWKDALLQQQANWGIRAFLEASPYCHYLFLYHIRDNKNEGYPSTGTYTSCGISFDRRDIERGTLELKELGEKLKHFIEELGDYHFTHSELENNTKKIYCENDKGEKKVIEWQLNWEGEPKIVYLNDEPTDPVIDIEALKEAMTIKKYLQNEVNKKDEEINNILNNQ